MQYPVGIPRLDIRTPTIADFEQLLDVIRGRLIVIYILGFFPWGSLVVTCKLENIRPVHQEPSFEIVLCRMRVEACLWADPRTHLRFGTFFDVAHTNIVDSALAVRQKNPEGVSRGAPGFE